MTIGMHSDTGKQLSGLDELWQRVTRLLKTRKGTLVGRRGYGSDLPALVDGNLTATFVLDLYAATVDAVADPDNGLSDFTLKKTEAIVEGNAVVLYLTGEYASELVTLNGVVL